LEKVEKMEKQKTKKRKINILKVTALITSIMSLYIMYKTNNKLIYSIGLTNIIISYFYIVGYKKGGKKNV
jgi:1,4-dihydroxy-2-naphthoate octaprenyltransferase